MKRFFEAVAKNAESPSSVVWGRKINNNKINNQRIGAVGLAALCWLVP